MMKEFKYVFPLIFLIFLGCGDNLPVIVDFGDSKYSLFDQDSVEVIFPDIIKGKVIVMGFIFTNCPDICPLTTNNMRLIQQRIKEEKIPNVGFVSLSFDPEVDSTYVLKRYAELRRLDLTNWIFLTGDKSVIDSLVRDAGVVAIQSDSTRTKEGREVNFYIHTDRISLLDEKGRIRKNYIGSQIDISEVVNDLKNLIN